MSLRQPHPTPHALRESEESCFISLPTYSAGDTPHSTLTVPGDLSFCTRCKRDIRQDRVTVRIEGRIYCASCELDKEEDDSYLDMLFNEAREMDFDQAPYIPSWND